MARDDQVCSAAGGWTVGRLVRPVAKFAAIALAAVSGAYAILSYYSSIDALRAAVEANKLTLLIYCESNNNSDKGCEKVRDDVSSDPAVASIFDDGPSTTGGAQPLQTPFNVTRSTTSSPGDSVPIVDDHAGTELWTDSATRTTLVTSIIKSSGPGSSAPLLITPYPGSPSESGGNHDDPNDPDYLPSDYSSWYKICSTLETRMRTVEQRMRRTYCPWPSSPPRDYEVLTLHPTSKLSTSCSDLNTQFFEAKRGYEVYSCSGPHIPLSTTGILDVERPSASSIAFDELDVTDRVPEGRVPESHTVTRIDTFMIVRSAVEMVMVALVIGYLIRRLWRFWRTRNAKRLNRGYLLLGDDAECDEKIENHSAQRSILL